jgi:hypothetical protein
LWGGEVGLKVLSGAAKLPQTTPQRDFPPLPLGEGGRGLVLSAALGVRAKMRNAAVGMRFLSKGIPYDKIPVCSITCEFAPVGAKLGTANLFAPTSQVWRECLRYKVVLS